MLVHTGQEYPAIVEFAPFQKTAKKRNKKKDAKCGTINEGKLFIVIKKGILFTNIHISDIVPYAFCFICHKKNNKKNNFLD